MYLCTSDRVNFLGKQADTVCFYLCASYRVTFQGMQAETVYTCAFHRGLINSGATDHLSSFSQSERHELNSAGKAKRLMATCVCVLLN